MTDPKTLALELVAELEHEAMGSDSYDSGTAIAIRLAITQIPTTSWQTVQTAPTCEWVRLLVCVVGEESVREVIDAVLLYQGWCRLGSIDPLSSHLRPIAWRPADSTDLPADWETG